MAKKIETVGAPKALGPYSQAVIAGNLVFISGQLPIDPKTALIKGETIQEKTHQVINNIEAILQATGLTLENVVSVQVFLTDLENDFARMNEAYVTRFNFLVPPARTTIQAARLPLASPIEIACVASI